MLNGGPHFGGAMKIPSSNIKYLAKELVNGPMAAAVKLLR
jgi:hypothetical protein